MDKFVGVLNVFLDLDEFQCRGEWRDITRNFPIVEDCYDCRFYNQCIHGCLIQELLKVCEN